MFRALRPDEVECRIGTVSKQGKGLSLLLYKTSRTDMDLLDETVGPERWQCDFKDHKGTLFGGIGIKVADEWVWKWNAGSPSDMEAAKGEASDAMKRSGFAWGIGRELYTAPFIWVSAQDCNLTDRNGKWVSYDTFSVTEMTVDDGRITRLTVVNDKTGKVVHQFGKTPQNVPERPRAATPPKPQMTEEEKAECAEIAEQLGGDRSAVFAAYKANGMEGARALLAFNPTQINLYDKEQEF